MDVSTLRAIDQLAESAPLLMAFRGRTREEWRQWRRRWLRRLRGLLGFSRPRGPIEALTTERVRREGYVRERVLYRRGASAWVPSYVLIPESVRPGERRPAVLCAHGHDPYNAAKRAVAGIDEDEEVARVIQTYNCDYARQLALRGYIAIAPDWHAFGERLDRRSFRGGDPCDRLQLMASWLGYNILGLDVQDAVVGVDYLLSREDVDPSRIGMVGLSYGGRVTTFAAAIDVRIRVAVVSGAMNLFVDRIRERGSCGSQVVPGLLRWGDVPEVLGLIAPRPLLIERGLRDPLIPPDSFVEGIKRLRRIYRAAGAPDCLVVDEFEGAHVFHGEKAYPWLDRWLR